MNTKDLTRIALSVAFLSVCSIVKIPITIIPVTLQTFGLLVMCGILGRKSVIAVIVYILLGIIGIPVFSGFGSGFGVILGPTGGFIIGFIPMSLFVGRFYNREKNIYYNFGVMVIGSLILYVVGVAIFCYNTNMGVAEALPIVMYPFIIGDLLKIIVALLTLEKIPARIFE